MYKNTVLYTLDIAKSSIKEFRYDLCHKWGGGGGHSGWVLGTVRGCPNAGGGGYRVRVRVVFYPYPL